MEEWPDKHLLICFMLHCYSCKVVVLFTYLFIYLLTYLRTYIAVSVTVFLLLTYKKTPSVSNL